MEKMNMKTVSTEEAIQQKKQPIYSSIFRRAVKCYKDNMNDMSYTTQLFIFNIGIAVAITSLTWCGIDNYSLANKFNTRATLEYKTSLNAIQKDLQKGDKQTTIVVDKVVGNTLGYGNKPLLNSVVPKYSDQLAVAALKDVIRQDNSRKFTLTTAPIMYISDKYNVNKYISTKRQGNNYSGSGLFEITVAGAFAFCTILVDVTLLG